MKILVFQISYTLLNNPNPMNILFMIIASTLILSMMSFMTTLNYWTSILIIITYIGGLMILFLYVISLLPNSKQKWTNSYKLSTSSIILMMMWMTMMTLSMKTPMKTITLSYFNNLWNLMLIMMIILIMAQMASKIIFLPFKMMKSTY